MTDHPLPTEADVLHYFETCTNWGRWGPEDNAGTINLITPEKRRQAAGLVRTGRAVSLSRPWNTVGGPGNTNPALHYLRYTEAASMDFVGVSYHGYATTHIDALCHIFWDGRMYNGRPASLVTTQGAAAAAVDAWAAEGILTRGVLVDIPRFRGVPFVDLDEPVRGWEIEAAAAVQGVTIEPGDALVIFSNRDGFYAAYPDRALGAAPRPGVHADAVPVFRERDVSLIVWDQLDATPSGYPVFDSPPAPGGPIHVLAIVYLGLPLLDNALLGPLAAACAEEGRWDFMLSVNPLYIRGATGSPVNPLAVF